MKVTITFFSTNAGIFVAMRTDPMDVRMRELRLLVPRLGDRLCVHAVCRPRQRPRPLLLPVQGTKKDEDR